MAARVKDGSPPVRMESRPAELAEWMDCDRTRGWNELQRSVCDALVFVAVMSANDWLAQRAISQSVVS